MGGIYHDGDYYAGSDTNDRAPKSIITNDTAYNPSKSYVVGDWFIDGDVLYEVKTACTGVTPPNATYYTVKTLHDLKSEVTSIKNGWKKLALVSLSSTPIDYVVSPNYTEFLISAGGNNRGQIYGGMSVILPAENSGNVYFIPCYNGTTFTGIICVNYRLIPAGQPNAGSYGIRAYSQNWTGSIPAAINVYAKPQ